MAAELINIPFHRWLSLSSKSRNGTVIFILFHERGASFLFQIIKDEKLIISKSRRECHERTAQIFLQSGKRLLFTGKSIETVAAAAHKSGKAEPRAFSHFRRQR